MAQTSIQTSPDAAREGQISTTYPKACIAAVMGSSPPTVGTFCKRTAGDNPITASALAATGDVTGAPLAGVLVLDVAREAGAPAQYDVGSVMRKGRIWVYSETAQVWGSTPYIRFATSVNGDTVGRIRNDVDNVSAADHAVQPANGTVRVMTTLSAAGLCEVEINLP